MIQSKHEVGSHHSFESEEDCGSKDGGEQQKKMKKLRSIKLSRTPSLKQLTRKDKSQFSLGMLSSSSSSSSSSDASTPHSHSDSSPNYVKTTRSSEARNNYFQKSPASRPISKPLKPLTRASSARIKKALMRKSVGGTEMKRKVKQYVETTGDSGERELQSPVSFRNSKTGNRSNGQRFREVSVYSKPKSISPGQRSGIMLTRKSSLKPVRKLAKMATFKSKKYSMEMSQFPESCVEKATCSSALKGSKFPDRIELQLGEERESEKTAVRKVCPYSYCSLHGHSHASVPPLKRFKSMRKRALEAQKGKRSENHSLSKTKKSGNRKEGIQASEMVSREVAVAHEISSAGRQVSAAVEDSGLTDINYGETSYAKGKDTSNAGEYNLKDSMASSAFDFEQMECQSEASEEIKGDLEVEFGSLSRSDSNSSISLNITAKVQEINPKYIRMWHLVYKNVVNSDSGSAKIEQPHHGVEKETSMEADNKLLGEANSSSYTALSDVDQEGADAAYRKLELCKNQAIKLVQEAFDKILLPEIQDQSPHYQDSGEKIIGRIQAEVGGPSISISSFRTSSVGEDLVPGPEETQAKSENVTTVEEKKTMPIVGNRSDQQVPKRWSNLKKLILLKRFVKALEKVRRINPQKPRYLPIKPDPEGEKVYLKRRTTEERKNGEEWMLDYALQKVISKLGPDQKKRVSLLIEAFETVLPMPGIKAHIKNKSAISEDLHQAHGGSDETGKESECQNGVDTLIEKLSHMKHTVRGSADEAFKVEHQSLTAFSDKNEANVENFLEKSEQAEPVHETIDREWRVGEIVACNLDKVERETTVTNGHPGSVDICLPEVEDAILNSETSQKPEGTESTSFQEVSVNGKLLKIHKGVISRLNAELYNGDLELDRATSKEDSLTGATGGESDTSKSLSTEGYEKSAAVKSLTSEDYEKPTKFNNVECSTSACALLEKTRVAIVNRSRAAQSEAGSIQEESTPPEEIKTVCRTDEANEIQLEEKKNASMWFLIFKHMVSSVDTKDGSEPLVDDTDKGEKKFSVRKSNMEMEDIIAEDPNVELQCSEAVKLVNEAIDEIPLPESSNSTPDQLFSLNLIKDQGLPKEKRGEGSELFLSVTNHSEKNASKVSDKTSASCDTVSDPDEGSLKFIDVNSQEEGKKRNLVSKPNQPAQKNWSNLKKVILLKRFIRAVEKVKKFNPRQPKFLPLVQDAESEKVQLRHQDTEDKKNGEEWMLDYALQQAVAKLTPVRKRKVELLVQAFETVNPAIRK